MNLIEQLMKENRKRTKQENKVPQKKVTESVKLLSSYSPDELTDLVNEYYWDYSPETHERIWNEIMDRFEDEALANDVLASLEDEYAGLVDPVGIGIPTDDLDECNLNESENPDEVSEGKKIKEDLSEQDKEELISRFKDGYIPDYWADSDSVNLFLDYLNTEKPSLNIKSVCHYIGEAIEKFYNKKNKDSQLGLRTYEWGHSEFYLYDTEGQMKYPGYWKVIDVINIYYAPVVEVYALNYYSDDSEDLLCTRCNTLDQISTAVHDHALDLIKRGVKEEAIKTVTEDNDNKVYVIKSDYYKANPYTKEYSEKTGKKTGYLGLGGRSWVADDSNNIMKFSSVQEAEDAIKKYVYAKYRPEVVEFNESLHEDTIKKKNGKWTNKGKDGEHGEFATKKKADAQRKAMYANGYKGESKKVVRENLSPEEIKNTRPKEFYELLSSRCNRIDRSEDEAITKTLRDNIDKVYVEDEEGWYSLNMRYVDRVMKDFGFKHVKTFTNYHMSSKYYYRDSTNTYAILIDGPFGLESDTGRIKEKKVVKEGYDDYDAEPRVRDLAKKIDSDSHLDDIDDSDSDIAVYYYSFNNPEIEYEDFERIMQSLGFSKGMYSYSNPEFEVEYYDDHDNDDAYGRNGFTIYVDKIKEESKKVVKESYDDIELGRTYRFQSTLNPDEAFTDDEKELHLKMV